MMKFLRKHNKKLLAIFMALLMIVFIGGSALQTLLTPKSNRLVARSRVGDIDTRDVQRAKNTTNLLGLLGNDWRQPVGRTAKPLKQEIDWILLAREATLMGSPPQTAQVAASFPPAVLGNFARQVRQRPGDIRQALAEWGSVRATALAVASAAVPSEADVQRAVRLVLEKVKVNAVSLPAEAFVDESDDSFTEAEITAQFQEYRNNEKGPGLEFGYYQHPKLRVNFISIDRDTILDALKITDLERKARKYYDENRTRDRAFRRPPEQLAGGDTEGPPPDEYLSWEEARSIAEEAVRRKEADEAVDRIADWLVQSELMTWSDSSRNEDGYRVARDTLQDDDHYETLVAVIPRRIAYPGAVSVWSSSPFTRLGAPDVALIGEARYSGRAGTKRFGDLAFRSQPIVPKIPVDDGAETRDYLALYETCRYVLKNPKNGNAYIFRVVDHEEGRPAESVDEVRDEIMNDLRLLRGMEEATARAESLRSCAAGGGSLQDSFESDEELVEISSAPEWYNMGFFQPGPVARASRFQAIDGRPESGVYIGSGVGTVPNDVIDRCFQMEYAEEKLIVANLRSRAAAVVLEWVETERPDQEAFAELRKELADRMAGRRQQAALADWFDPDNIRLRNELKPVSR